MEINQEVGSGDFEGIQWSTFTKQFKAYRNQHPKSKITTIREFADDISKHPHHYKAHTVKRARFYLNAQQKKKKTPAEKEKEEEGGKLNAKELKSLIDSSYETNTHNLDDFDADHELSSDRVKVYKRKGDSKQAVVVHRGTQGLGDTLLDLHYVMGKNIDNSERFQHAKDIQQRAENKYGAHNISTVGHSLGSKIASTVGQNSNEIINLNKSVAPHELFNKVSSKETNIRTKYDPVSATLGLRGDKNTFTIPSFSMNPLKEHSSDALKRVADDQMFGV